MRLFFSFSVYISFSLICTEIVSFTLTFGSNIHSKKPLDIHQLCWLAASSHTTWNIPNCFELYISLYVRTPCIWKKIPSISRWQIWIKLHIYRITFCTLNGLKFEAKRNGKINFFYFFSSSLFCWFKETKWSKTCTSQTSHFLNEICVIFRNFYTQNRRNNGIWIFIRHMPKTKYICVFRFVSKTTLIHMIVTPNWYKIVNLPLISSEI